MQPPSSMPGARPQPVPPRPRRPGFAFAGWLLAGYLAATAALGAAPDAFEMNRRLGRGINLGNALEAPAEGEWGIRLEADYFRRIKEAGFQSVRLPVRWSAHAAAAAPYTLDETFARRVDWALDQAEAQGLAVVLNVHHYQELFGDPERHRDRLLGLWRQIAARHRQRPESVVFELLNEPHDRLDDDAWNRLLVDLLREVRAVQPERVVMIGPAGWNSPAHLPRLRLPDSDRRIIVTFHYYHPFEFTHQGATWIAQSPPTGRRWTGTTAEKQALTRDFAAAADWAKAERRPLHLGEFGALDQAADESRARWTRAVREEAEKRGMAWAYWEFGAGFGAYDRKAQQWREPLLRALIPAR